jgi:hypothetical protein
MKPIINFEPILFTKETLNLMEEDIKKFTYATQMINTEFIIGIDSLPELRYRTYEMNDVLCYIDIMAYIVTHSKTLEDKAVAINFATSLQDGRKFRGHLEISLKKE